jgi:hypothetical protein
MPPPPLDVIGSVMVGSGPDKTKFFTNNITVSLFVIFITLALFYSLLNILIDNGFGQKWMTDAIKYGSYACVSVLGLIFIGTMVYIGRNAT